MPADAVPGEVMQLMNGMMTQLAMIQAASDEERDAQYEVLAGMLTQAELASTGAAAAEAGVGESSALALPQLFVLGDSISIQYGRFLALSLQGVFSYSRKNQDADASDSSLSGQNGGTSSDVLEYLKTLPDRDGGCESWILLNSGLWDVRRDQETGVIHVPLTHYRTNVRSILELASAKGFKHIYWVRTTHVDDEVHSAKAPGDFTRKMADIELYNDAADEICKECGVKTIDLAPASEGLGAEAFKDHVHFTAEVAGRQGGLIAGVLMSML
jgi:lysophospholipase L1-like esterase